MSPTRRQALKWGIGLGALAGAGVAGRAVLLPPPPSAELAPLPDLAILLFETLDEDERAEVVFNYEHAYCSNSGTCDEVPFLLPGECFSSHLYCRFDCGPPDGDFAPSLPV